MWVINIRIGNNSCPHVPCLVVHVLDITYSEKLTGQPVADILIDTANCSSQQCLVSQHYFQFN
jgi:hypothetical protein